ncbi:hypothetical protein LEMLEM_LOCUS24000, partial [Lemmus lemmus]
ITVSGGQRFDEEWTALWNYEQTEDAEQNILPARLRSIMDRTTYFKKKMGIEEAPYGAA